MKDIDRISPTVRPARAAVLRQRWAELGFLHWPVPVAALRPLVPRALTIDTYEGTAYVGLVPFTVTGGRAMRIPLPGVSHFHEVNVRTYVHLDGAHPGVWFWSLDASNAVVVAAARALFRLPYHHARMAMDTDANVIDFRSERKDGGAECSLRYQPIGAAGPPEAGSLEHFLAERYLLYAASKDTLWRGQVHHRPYPLQRARVEIARETLVAAAGVVRPEAPPPLVHFAREVEVEIFPLRRV